MRLASAEAALTCWGRGMGGVVMLCDAFYEMLRYGMVHCYMVVMTFYMKLYYIRFYPILC